MLLPGGQVGGILSERIAVIISLTCSVAACCVDEIVFGRPKRVQPAMDSV